MSDENFYLITFGAYFIGTLIGVLLIAWKDVNYIWVLWFVGAIVASMGTKYIYDKDRRNK